MQCYHPQEVSQSLQLPDPERSKAPKSFLGISVAGTFDQNVFMSNTKLSMWSYSHFPLSEYKRSGWRVGSRKKKRNDLLFAKRKTTGASILNRSLMQITRTHGEVGDVNLTAHVVLNLIENCDRFIYLSPPKHIADITLESKYRQVLNSEKWVMDWLYTHFADLFCQLLVSC